MDRPITTLFMNMSVDGKISTGDTDLMDTCLQYPKIKWICEGYQQYYDIEQTTDLYSLNSARVLTKSHNGKSINDVQEIEKTVVNFIVIDNKPHLTSQWVQNLIKKSDQCYVITTNPNHPAFEFQNMGNMTIIYYETMIDFKDLFTKFKEVYHIESLTIQTWWTLNALFLREKLIDKLSLILVPALVWGSTTSTLIDGESLHSLEELHHLKALKLTEVVPLKNSYLHLKYDVISDTHIIE
jgi:2,5-diamino-6-(ribosylamino)-4(3H)-pyrimidinone 5'-phosphate reductase